MNNPSAERMNDLLSLSHVPRWVIVPHIGNQSVAEHSFRTCVIFAEVCSRLGVVVTPRGFLWALVHDGPESRTGDLPTLVDSEPLDARVCQWWHDIKADIGPLWTDLVKVADDLETATYIMIHGFGSHAGACAARTRDRAYEKAARVARDYDLPRLPEVAAKIYQEIITEAERFGGTPRVPPASAQDVNGNAVTGP